MTVTNSIGSAGGRDYATWQIWHDALPSVLTDAYVGEGYNDSEFLITSAILMSGITTTPTNSIRMTAAAGQSFRDSAGALRYDASRGVAIRCATAYQDTLDLFEQDITIDRLQLSNEAGKNVIKQDLNSLMTHVFEGLIIEGNGVVNASPTRIRKGKIRNCLYVNRSNNSTANANYADYNLSLEFSNTTLVVPSDLTQSSGSAFANTTDSLCLITNCVSFGFFIAFRGSSSSDYLCSDYAIGLGSHNQSSKVYANQFVDSTDATRDFRLKAGSDCLDTGVDLSGSLLPAANDIFLTARPQGSAWDIGCFEYIAAGGSVPMAVFERHYRAQRA